MLHEDLTHQIIGLCFEVLNELGSGQSVSGTLHVCGMWWLFEAIPIVGDRSGTWTWTWTSSRILIEHVLVQVQVG